MRAAGEKITMLTAYDATFAAVADAAGVECILVGDSLGMVCQGLHSTVGVTLQDMAYHTASVTRGLHRAQATAWVIADMPYGSYAESPEQAMRNACELMQAGAHMVKLEGGGWTAPTVRFLVDRGVPVCAHLGLTPQTVHALGGYRVQGKDERCHPASTRAGAAGRRCQHAGAGNGARSPVCPADQRAAAVPHHRHRRGQWHGRPGSGAARHAGVNLGKMAKFVHNFMADAGSVKGAMEAYVQAVKTAASPTTRCTPGKNTALLAERHNGRQPD